MSEKFQHIIQTQHYQIQLDDEVGAYDFQSRISHLQNNVINNLLDRIMTDFSLKDYLIRFSAITLDLGTIKKENWEKELVYRIEEQLIHFLRANILENGDLRTGKKVRIKKRDIELLEHFLLYGYTSWNHSTLINPAALYKQLVAQQDKEFIQVLKKLGKKEFIRKRLVYQFDDTTLEKTVLAVTENKEQYIVRYKQDIINYQKVGKPVDTELSMFRKALWEVILAYLFTEKSSYHNTKFFLRYVIQGIARKYRISYAELIHAFAEGIRSYSKDVHLNVRLKQILVELDNEELSAKHTGSSTAQTGKTAQEASGPDLQVDAPEFESILDYFLKYKSFPIHSDIHSLQEFKNRFNRYALYSKKGNRKWVAKQDRIEKAIKALDKQQPESSGFPEQTQLPLKKKKEITPESEASSYGQSDSSDFEKINRLVREAENPGMELQYKNLLYELSLALQNKRRKKTLRHLLSQRIASFISRYTISKEALADRLIALLERENYTISGQKASKELKTYLQELSYKNVSENEDINGLLLQLNKILSGNLKDHSRIQKGLFRLIDQHAAISRDTIRKEVLLDRLITLLESEDYTVSGKKLHKDLKRYLQELSRVPEITDFPEHPDHKPAQDRKGEGVKDLLLQLNNVLSGSLTDHAQAQKELSRLIDHYVAISRNTVSKEVLLDRLITLLKRDDPSDTGKKLHKNLKRYLQELSPVSEITALPAHPDHKRTQDREDEGFNNLLLQLSKMLSANLKGHSQTRKELFRLIDQYAAEHQVAVHLVTEQLLKTLSSKEFSQKQIHRELRYLLGDRSGKQVSGVEPSPNFSLDLIRYYALYKTMPWWAGTTKPHQLNQHFDYLIKESPATLKKLFTDRKPGSDALLRMLPNPAFNKLIRLFDHALPESFVRVQALMEEFIRVNLLPLRTGAAKLLYTFRYTLIQQLATTSTRMDEVQLIRHWMDEIAGELNLDKHAVIELLDKHTQQSRGPQSRLQGTFVQRYLESTLSGGVAKENMRPLVHAVSEELYEWLLAALPASAASESMSALVEQRLLSYNKEHPDLFIRQLMNPVLRRSIVRKLSAQHVIYLVLWNSDDNRKKVFNANFSFWNRIRKHLTVTQQERVWEIYLDMLLLKRALEPHSLWKVKDLARILYHSLKVRLGTERIRTLVHTLETSGTHLPMDKREKELHNYFRQRSRRSLPEQSRLSPVEKASTEKLPTEEEFPQEGLFITGAGVVLLGPFIPMLFKKLNLLGETDFLDELCRMKAIHLLHYAVSGNTQIEEQHTLLYKLICGMNPEIPLDITIPVKEEEQTLIDGLLASVIQQWSILKSTSVTGLRETFLQRDGKIRMEEQTYMLYVEQKAYDMLLDQIPWSISKVKYSWMKKMLSVEWR